MCNRHTDGRVGDLRILRSVMTALAPLPDDFLVTSAECWPASRQSDLPLPVGSRWGRLILQGPTARGSFGTVYRAFDPRLDVDVALKLPNSALPDDQLNGRLLQEAARLSRVGHRGVVKMYGAATKRCRAGLWMELLRGQTLDQVLRDDGPLIAVEVARIGRHLCAALHAIHAAGLVHGDLKPQNVVREGPGRVVVVDFGSACEISRPASSRHRLTGTPLYLAPEVLIDGDTSVASDIYSLGVLLFHLASSEYPVQGDTVEELVAGFRRRNVRRLRVVRPDLPDDLCELVDGALRIDPRARFRSARDMQRALARVVVGSPSSVAVTAGAA